MEKAIIGATVTLIIFVFTQIFIHLRDRQTFLREKLEHLFSALNEISSKVIDTYYRAQSFEENGEREQLEKQLKAIDKALYQPRILFLLYFPYLTKTWEDLFVTDLRAYVTYCDEASQDQSKFSSEECKKRIDELCIALRSLQNFLAQNTSLTTQSISFHFKRLITGKVKISI